MEAPKNWVDELAHDILNRASEKFMADFDPAANKEEECSFPPMMFVTRVFPEGVETPTEVLKEKTAVMAVAVPSKFVHEIFKDKESKGMAVYMAGKFLTEDMPWPYGDPGPADAVYVASEAWTARYKEEKEREGYESVKDMPTSQNAIIVCVYEAASMSLYVQKFNSDGTKDGEPSVNKEANLASGVMVRNVIKH